MHVREFFSLHTSGQEGTLKTCILSSTFIHKIESLNSEKHDLCKIYPKYN